MEGEKGSFSGRVGFVLAAAGSAVGLGNIWRFPYLAAKQGGGIFLLVYILLVVFIGFFLDVTEAAIGRKTGKSTLHAFGAIVGKYRWVGLISSLVPVIILPYYSVVGGWVVRYFASYMTGGGATLTSDTAFSSFISQNISPIVCFLVFFVATAVIVSMGVEKGIEKASRIMMPVLVVLCVATAVYTLTLDGAWEGVKYLFVPNFSQLTMKTVFSAMSQMFYSLSLSMGIMVTYGAYMKKSVPLDKAIGQVALFDTGIAIVAAMMVVPGVFAFSHGDLSALNKGAGLMFITLPKVFASMPIGNIVGALFFLLVLFAALTSSISLMEAIVSELREVIHCSRIVACLWVSLYGVIVGVFSSLGFGLMDGVRLFGFNIFDFCDFLSNSVMMPLGALLICLFVAWIAKPECVIDEVMVSSPFKSQKVYRVVMRYIAPLIIIAVLVTSVMEGLGLLAY